MIGISGTFAAVTAVKEAGSTDTARVLSCLEEQVSVIAATRPTATNLSWAVRRMTEYVRANVALPFTLLADNMAAYAMQQGVIDMVFVSDDRVAANGEILRRKPVYMVCAYWLRSMEFRYFSILRCLRLFSIQSGDEITVEQRDHQEAMNTNGRQAAPEDTPVLNPAFDVTPHQYFNAIITEKGVAYPPFTKSLQELREK